MKRPAFSTIVGALLALLGGTVMLGWWLQLSPVVRVVPGFTPMVFNTALSFVLAGSALAMSFSPPGGYRRATPVLGSALATMAAPVLAEHVLHLLVACNGDAILASIP